MNGYSGDPFDYFKTPTSVNAAFEEYELDYPQLKGGMSRRTFYNWKDEKIAEGTLIVCKDGKYVEYIPEIDTHTLMMAFNAIFNLGSNGSKDGVDSILADFVTTFYVDRSKVAANEFARIVRAHVESSHFNQIQMFIKRLETNPVAVCKNMALFYDLSQKEEYREEWIESARSLINKRKEG